MCSSDPLHTPHARHCRLAMEGVMMSGARRARCVPEGMRLSSLGRSGSNSSATVCGDTCCFAAAAAAAAATRSTGVGGGERGDSGTASPCCSSSAASWLTAARRCCSVGCGACLLARRPTAPAAAAAAAAASMSAASAVHASLHTSLTDAAIMTRTRPTQSLAAAWSWAARNPTVFGAMFLHLCSP